MYNGWKTKGVENKLVRCAALHNVCQLSAGKLYPDRNINVIPVST